MRRGLPEPDGDARRDRRVRRRARAHDRPRQHAGPLLRPPDARPDPRHGHVEDPRDQAACRRRLRLPHRSAQCRADHGVARAPRRRQRAHDHQPRGDLHHPSRPAADRHPPQARHAQGRQDHRGGMRMLPARRRPFRLRRGDHPLCRLDAVRDLRPAQRQIYRQARAHQHAALRRVPRPRHRRRPLRLREPARRDGGRARARPAGGAARELPHRAHLHRQRPDGEQLRPAGMRRLGREGERLGRAQGQAAEGQGPGLCLLALHQRRVAAGQLDRRAACDREDQARFRRLHRRALGRRRDRPGFVDHPGADRGRGARARSVAHSHRHRRQRGGAEGQRLLFLARDLHGRQRRHRRGAEPQARAGGGGRAQARRQAGRDRVPGRALPRRRAGPCSSPA